MSSTQIIDFCIHFPVYIITNPNNIISVEYVLHHMYFGKDYIDGVKNGMLQYREYGILIKVYIFKKYFYFVYDTCHYYKFERSSSRPFYSGTYTSGKELNKEIIEDMIKYDSNYGVNNNILIDKSLFNHLSQNIDIKFCILTNCDDSDFVKKQNGTLIIDDDLYPIYMTIRTYGKYSANVIYSICGTYQSEDKRYCIIKFLLSTKQKIILEQIMKYLKE